jgi:hypothetical protein
MSNIELPQPVTGIKQIGAYAEYLTEVTADVDMSPEQVNMRGDEIEVTAGSIKNEGTTAVIVRMEFNAESGKFINSTLQTGEIITWEDLPVYKIGIPDVNGQTTASVSVSVIAWSYITHPNLLRPKIKLR